MKQIGVILAGGKGTRLTKVLTDRPKPLAMTRGKPFIEWVISFFSQYGVKNFIISLGHLSSVAETYFSSRKRDNVSIATITEKNPLGTGGAFCYATQNTEADIYLLSNGDSLFLADLCLAYKALTRADVDGVIIGRKMEDTSRYGRLIFDDDGLLTDFLEKKPGSGVVNGGIYIIKRRLIECLPVTIPMSMEIDGIPSLLRQGARIMVYVSDAPFLDIGLPETLAQADGFIQEYFLMENKRKFDRDRINFRT